MDHGKRMWVVMQEKICTCSVSMMADHNAICEACAQQPAGVSLQASVESMGKKKVSSSELCTCDERMMADHNAGCEACTGNR